MFRLIFPAFFLAGVAAVVAEEERAPGEPDAGFSVAALTGEREYTSRGSYFEVAARDQLSGLFVSSLAEALMQRFERSFALRGSFSPRILVNLVPEEEFYHPGPFHTVVRQGGQVIVHIRWSAETTREFTERALAQGLLTRLSFGYTRETGIHVPLWAELALQHLIRVEANASHKEWLRDRARARSPLQLETILEASREERSSSVLEANAYWFWVFLDSEGRRPGDTRNFLIRILRGEEPREALLDAFGGRFADFEEARLWWLVGLNEALRGRGIAPMRSARESARRVEELARLTVSIEEEHREDGETEREEAELANADGKERASQRETETAPEAEDANGGIPTRDETRLSVGELWEYRESMALREEVGYRLQTLQIELGMAHPFYRNAYLSLGQALEGLLLRDEDAFKEGVRLWRIDLREGRQLDEETSRVLDDLSEELDARHDAAESHP